MNKYKWCWSLLAVPLVMLISSTVGCANIYETPTDESAPTSASPSYGPVINSFTVSSETASPGQSISLSWNVSNATIVTIHPAVGSVGSSGTKWLSPATTTVYTLTATNEAGSSTSSVTVTVTSDDKTLIGCDPVTGRNQGISFTWEQLCLSSEYQVQIAKDPGFTQVVFDSGAVAPASSTSPALLYPAGGAILPGLEAGHTYYWRARVRRAATGQPSLSPWSETKTFTIKAGLPTSTQYFGTQLVSPNNGCTDCPVKPASFSWTPFKEATKYKFVLAKDAALTDIVAQAEVTTTAYEYGGTLDYSTSYYWQVMSVEPAPSEWSATFSFITEAEPSLPPIPEVPPATPLWAWVVIGIGAVLVIITIILIFMVRRK